MVRSCVKVVAPATKKPRRAGPGSVSSASPERGSAAPLPDRQARHAHHHQQSEHHQAVMIADDVPPRGLSPDVGHLAARRRTCGASCSPWLRSRQVGLDTIRQRRSVDHHQHSPEAPVRSRHDRAPAGRREEMVDLRIGQGSMLGANASSAPRRCCRRTRARAARDSQVETVTCSSAAAAPTAAASSASREIESFSTLMTGPGPHYLGTTRVARRAARPRAQQRPQGRWIITARGVTSKPAGRRRRATPAWPMRSRDAPRATRGRSRCRRRHGRGRRGARSGRSAAAPAPDAR
jgi:hypothetical protein